MNTRNSTESRSKAASPFHRLTVKDVLRDYQAGLITPAGAIFYWVSCTRKQGLPVRISQRQILRDLDISKATFYRAIAQLEDEIRISVCAPDELVLVVPTSTTEGTPDYIFFEELSQICDESSQKCDSQSQICDESSQKCDSQSQICDNQRLERAVEADSEEPQILQINQIYTATTTSPAHPPAVVAFLSTQGIELTESQLTQVEEFSEEDISNAAKVVQTTKKPENKVRLFFKALRNGWKANLPADDGGEAKKFATWYNRAHAQGRVIASMSRADGGIDILMSDERWLPLEAAILEVAADD